MRDSVGNARTDDLDTLLCPASRLERLYCTINAEVGVFLDLFCIVLVPSMLFEPTRTRGRRKKVTDPGFG